MSIALSIPQITHVREKPCKNCKSHVFYIASRKCRACALSQTKADYEANREKRIQQRNEWCADNLGYLRKYRNAYRLRKQDELAVLIAVLLMTTQNLSTKEIA